MAKTSVKGRNAGGPRQRAVAAAARAAAKRAERAERAEQTRAEDDPPPVVAGRTVVVDGADGTTVAGAEAEAPDGDDGARGAGGRADGSAAPAEARPEPSRQAGRARRDAATRTRTGSATAKTASTSSTGVTRAPDDADDRGTARVVTTRHRWPAAGRLRGRPRLFRGLLALVTLIAVAAAGLLGWEHRQTGLTGQARTEATAVARKAAPKILSYDYRHLEKDFDAARAHLTGGFRKEFAKTTEKVVTPTAEKYHGVVKATVAEPPGGGAPAVSVVSASSDEVVVLLFMNQVTESKKLDKPRMDLNRVRMTLVDTPEGWKVSAVDAL